MADVTNILGRIEYGDPSAAEELLPLVYDELRKLARVRLSREQPGQTLQATALVHEAYLRLVDNERAEHWDSRGHFFSAAAEAMRRILVDQARHKKTVRAGGGHQRVEMSQIQPTIDAPTLDLLALDEALRELEQKDPRKAELIKLRFFAGLSNQQASDVLGIAASTADLDWAYARSWLRLQMSDTVDSDG
jgi:RNA polymerase sigma factor (TIGR02999 family)